ncbi:MAG: glutaredoxin family protein [Proteobacteria bacterium]|nr:glutaredoxin family protein [Pseudomonadota bacterium]
MPGFPENKAPTLIVYSREGCHLCEDMLETLRQYQSELGYRLKVYDIDDDVSLLEQFNTLVPVVYLDGKELMRYFFELATLKAALEGVD